MINYLDVTHTKYSKGKFGSKNHGMLPQNLLLISSWKCQNPGKLHYKLETDVDNNKNNARVVFYNKLSSSDVMGLISSMNFSNHPAMSTELVKFLLLNTLVEAVDKLTEQAESMISRVISLQRELTGVTKSNTTVGNKYDV